MSDKIEIEITPRVALTMIAGERCSSFTAGDCFSAGRHPLAKYGADRCCDACIAAAGLKAMSEAEAER